jgi:hypothetical protein
MRILFVIPVLVVALSSCKEKKGEKKQEDLTPLPDTTITAKPATDTALLTQAANQVLAAFNSKDYVALSLLVHPDSGVRFSPYAYIDTASDKVVTADWIKKQADKTKQEKVLWGTVDPTDEPINMTVDNYVRRFVYDVDFLKPEKFKVNEFIGSGNTVNNLQAIYNNCDFTESHFSGFEKKYDGMDWRSLRLVFRMKDGKYYLVGVVHDEWTT